MQSPEIPKKGQDSLSVSVTSDLAGDSKQRATDAMFYVFWGIIYRMRLLQWTPTFIK